MSYFVALFIYLSFGFPAYANYSVQTLERADAQGGISDESFARVSAIQGMFLGIKRALTRIEYEAFGDAVNGLPLEATLDNGETADLGDVESVRAAIARIDRHPIVKVEYLAGSLPKLGKLLLTSCQALKRKNCVVYKDYQGLDSPGARPFTLQQERMIKWATAHTLPHDRLDSFAIRVGCQQMLDMVPIMSRAAQATSSGFLRLAFPPSEAVDLHRTVVAPYIDAVFEQIVDVHTGKKTN